MGAKAVARAVKQHVRTFAEVVAMPSVEAYAKSRGLLHPEITALLTPHFPGLNWANVRVEVHPQTWSKFGQSGRGRPAPIFVVFNTIYVAEGFLNRPGRLWGNTLDLGNETGEGWETLAHEVAHVAQYVFDGGALMLWRYLSGWIRSKVATGGARSWYHASIPFEQEADALGKRVAGVIVRQATPGFWVKWKGIG